MFGMNEDFFVEICWNTSIRIEPCYTLLVWRRQHVHDGRDGVALIVFNANCMRAVSPESSSRKFLQCCSSRYRCSISLENASVDFLRGRLLILRRRVPLALLNTRA
eukprot:gb/GECG01002606.1/.p1 GENE.gb/GECG01002606.1/~~gb/GECG01002606.1/.p1  ORF type:complete len:106 (+),score=4.26 gb/GECG01002606.1/:1-318(+)